jgi:hypothetical protein
MLIRAAAALALALAACLGAPEPSLDERQDNIICGPLCAPGYASLVEDTYSYGFRLFPDAGTLGEGCADLGAGWDCVVTLLTPSTNRCGSVTVECVARPGLPARCSWSAVDSCQ